MSTPDQIFEIGTYSNGGQHWAVIWRDGEIVWKSRPYATAAEAEMWADVATAKARELGGKVQERIG